MKRRDVCRVDEKCLEGDEYSGTESIPTGDHPNHFPLVLWEPGDRDEHGGEGDHVSCAGAEDAVGERKGGDTGVETEVGEEGGDSKHQAPKY